MCVQHGVQLNIQFRCLLLCQSVDVRRFVNLVSVANQIPPTHVIHQDEQDVERLWLFAGVRASMERRDPNDAHSNISSTCKRVNCRVERFTRLRFVLV